MTSPAIAIEKLNVSWNSVPVLQDISLRLDEGEILTIVGPNGSGKSTLLKTIMGFKESDSGSISIFGMDSKTVRQHGIIGYLPQAGTYSADFPVNVYDVIAMAIQSRRRPFSRLTSDDRKTIEEVLERVDMSSFISHHFGSLSGGQKQRVLIARALALHPKILILDEPSTGLDTITQDNFHKLLVSLKQEGMAILLVSHDIGAVSTIVDRIACLKTKLYFHGTPDECKPSDTFASLFGNDIYLLNHRH